MPKIPVPEGKEEALQVQVHPDLHSKLLSQKKFHMIGHYISIKTLSRNVFFIELFVYLFSECLAVCLYHVHLPFKTDKIPIWRAYLGTQSHSKHGENVNC